MELDNAIQREWLETNGIGGFASSTVSGANTRRYHGLLTAATKPPVGRYVLLSKLEETIFGHDLSTNIYPGAIHPSGFDRLTGFDLDPVPTWRYEAAGVQIEKRVFMVNGENTTVVEYHVSGDVPPGARLEIRPLIAFRDYHSTTHANGSLNPTLTQEPGQVSIQPYPDLPRLCLAHNAVEIRSVADWYHNFEYPIERERGIDDHEDLFCPLVASFDISATRHAVIVASTDAHDSTQVDVLRDAEIKRRRRIREQAPSTEQLTETLVAAADQFIVRRGDLYSIVAGYHWFADWGRDTMIALPGLTLVTGRFEIAKSILLAYAAHIDKGMLPNRFPDSGEAPEYNTVDAALWFVQALRAYLDYTGDFELARKLYDSLVGIIDWHMNGTRYGIRTDYDGLLIAGGEGSQLTWMDAKIGDYVPTPRHGKPVEIQALWYNAIRFVSTLAARFGDNSSHSLLQELAPAVKASFNREFWDPASNCLFDVIDGDRKDSSIRPNQVIAISLPHNMLSRERTLSILAVAERQLLTPYGLRTLAPSDPRYRGRYEGGPAERDAIYHQGTVWPWLLGPFIRAHVNAHHASTQARAQAASWLGAFSEHVLCTGMLNQIPEILDGGAPHRERGCAAQAWSVAEILRALVEDIYQIKPQGENHEDHSPLSRGIARRSVSIGR